MSRRDIFHEAVRRGLEKEDWTITHDPMSIRVAGVDLSVDLGAERLIAAEKDGEKIAVEIKSFINPSAISEFHTALGQYLNYRRGLKEFDPERLPYLAVPEEIYKTFFQLPFVRDTISDYELKLLIYDPEKEIIVRWLS